MRGQAKHLTKGVAIYGAGDAAIQIVNLLLLPVYVKFNILTTADYGALALIGSAEALAKIVSRWGLDGAFMRFYHEREEGAPRQRMASTILWFMLAANGVLLAAMFGASSLIASLIVPAPGYVLALKLMFINIFLMSFTFAPLHAMRLRNEAATYSAFTLARAAGTLVLRMALVIWLRLGMTGVYLADVAMTAILLVAMARWFTPLLARTFSTEELKRALRFGLPRLPHGLASQALDSGPRLLLGKYFPQDTVGVYQNGATLGTGVSFFKSAFETAWAPFYYATAPRPDAKEIFSKMATYGVAVLVLLVAGTAAVARDVILVMLRPEYLAAVPVVPLIAVAIGLQGLYQLTSIGLNLTSRTEFYSAATITAALVGLGLGLWLIPAYGVTGAALTVLLSYSTQVTVAFLLAQRVYPMRYEVGRLARVVVCGAIAAGVAVWAVPSMPAIAGLFVRGATTVLVYAGLLGVSGFFRLTERAFIREMIARVRK